MSLSGISLVTLLWHKIFPTFSGSETVFVKMINPEARTTQLANLNRKKKKKKDPIISWLVIVEKRELKQTKMGKVH